MKILLNENLIIQSDYFFVLWLVHLPFGQGIPCLLEASNTTTGAILAQVAILKCSKKGHYLGHMGRLRLSNDHLMLHGKN